MFQESFMKERKEIDVDKILNELNRENDFCVDKKIITVLLCLGLRQKDVYQCNF